MKAQASTIGNVQGSGMAEVRQHHGDLKKCIGYMVVENESDALNLMNESGIKFSGPVYDNGEETHLTFPIVITHIGGGRIEFSASGNPYRKNS